MLLPNANIKTVSANGKYIVMSDCHRGDGSAADEFAHNSLIYKCALEYYLKEGFTYIELGDAEELWENDNFEQIYITHTSVYELLRRFHDPDPAKTRYLKVWGNHDLDWCDNPVPLRALFPGIQLHEAILLGGQDLNVSNQSASNLPVSPVALPILLLHGHQADPACSGFGAKISRFLVRRVWAGLQRFGIGDPTRAAENPGRCDEIDKTLYQMATANIVIAGHTHRPVFANLSLTERRFLESGIGTPGVRRKEKAESVYYNTGSCVHPRCITGLEITAHTITLAKWGYAAAPGAADPPYSLAIARTVLEKGKR
jgi:predicted phosphodiesterase